MVLFVGVYPILKLASKGIETFHLLPKTDYKTPYTFLG